MSASHDAAQALGTDLTVAYIEMGVPAELSYAVCRLNEEVEVLDALDEALARKADLNFVWPQWMRWLFAIELQKYKVSSLLAEFFSDVCCGNAPSYEDCIKLGVAAARVRNALPGTWRDDKTLYAKDGVEIALAEAEYSICSVAMCAIYVERSAEDAEDAENVIANLNPRMESSLAIRVRMIRVAQHLKTLLKEAT